MQWSRTEVKLFVTPSAPAMLILFNAHPTSVNHAPGGIRAGDRRYYTHFQKVTNHFHPLYQSPMATISTCFW